MPTYVDPHACNACAEVASMGLISRGISARTAPANEATSGAAAATLLT